MILFLDTETSDLPKKGFPIEDPSQPWVMSVAAMFTDMDGETTRGRLETLIRPDGRRCREGAGAVHGITERDCVRYGVSEAVPLGQLTGWMMNTRFVVGFGIEFDQFVIESVILRRNKDPRAWKRPGVKWICLRARAIELCKVPSEHESGTYRWPNLDTLCEVLLGETPREGHHSAWDDICRTQRAFLEMQRRGLVNLGDE